MLCSSSTYNSWQALDYDAALGPNFVGCGQPQVAKPNF